MPIYEYDCSSCGHRFERLVKRTDEPVECPQCASAEISKRFSVFASSSGGSGGEAPPAPA